MVMPGRTETAVPDAQPLRHDVGESHERTTADEQYVAGVDLHGFHFTMLAGPFHRHGGDGAFKDLEQRLLHALAGHVTRDGGVFAAFTGDLVDFVDIYDALLRTRHIPVSSLDEALQHGFDVIAHISCLGERGGVRYDERHVHHMGQRLREICFAHAGRPE